MNIDDFIQVTRGGDLDELKEFIQDSKVTGNFNIDAQNHVS